MTKTAVTILHPQEKLTLSTDLITGELIVHLGDPGPTLELAGHALAYGKLTLQGHGVFTVTLNGMVYERHAQ